MTKQREFYNEFGVKGALNYLKSKLVRKAKTEEVESKATERTEPKILSPVKETPSEIGDDEAP